MTSLTHNGCTLIIDGKSLSMQYDIRDAFVSDGRIIILIDPNAYLKDPAYSKERRRGLNPLKNLFALSMNGKLVWEAEFPEGADYYYSIESRLPLTVKSFSSYRCVIDVDTGKIKAKEFYK